MCKKIDLDYIEKLINKYELSSIDFDSLYIEPLKGMSKADIEFLLRDFDYLLKNQKSTKEDKPSRVLQSHKTKINNALKVLEDLKIDCDSWYYIKCYQGVELIEIVKTYRITSTEIAGLEAMGYDIEIVSPKQAYLLLSELSDDMEQALSLKGETERVHAFDTLYSSFLDIHTLTQKDIFEELMRRDKARLELFSEGKKNAKVRAETHYKKIEKFVNSYFKLLNNKTI